MQHINARKLLRSLLIVLACFSYSIQAQDVDCAQLGSSIGNLQSQLDICCANIKGQESIFQSCCDELRSNLDSLKSQFECTTEECCVVKFLTNVQELNDVDTADWSHDGRFIAIGLNTKVNLSGGDTIDPKVLKIYELEGAHLVLKAETSIGNQIGQVTVVRWHPTKYRLAVGRSDIDDSDENHLSIFDFNPATNSLKETDHAEGVDVYAVAWRSKPLDDNDDSSSSSSSSSSNSSSSSSSSSDEEFVLAVGRAPCNKCYELVTYIVSEAGHLSGPFPSKGIDTDGQISNKALDWDATSKFLVVGVELSSDNKVLQVYEYNPHTHGLKINARAHVPSLPGHAKTKATVLAVDWNPSNECRHLIAVGLKSCSKNPAEQLLQVFEHNGISGTLTYRNGVAGLKKSVYSVNWKDCTCLSIGKGGAVSSGGEFRTYRFDPDNASLALESSFDDFKNQNVQEVRWSPNGEFILNGAANNFLSVYNAVAECKKVSFCQLFTEVEIIQDKVCSILSKVCCLDCLGSCNPHLETCCSKLEAEIENSQITLCSKLDLILSKLDNLSFSRCDSIVGLDCCSIVDAIDQRTELILSKLCKVETGVEPVLGCCETVAIGVLAIPTCCSVIDVIDLTTQTILSKVCDLTAFFENDCSKLLQCITTSPGNICECSIFIPLTELPTCCSVIDVIDLTTQTILSKVCEIDQNLETCCSVIEEMINNFSINVEVDFQTTFSLIHDAQFTLCSKIENIDFGPFCDCVIPVEKCCFTVLSKVDIIDQRTETILSKVCDIQSAIDNLVFPDCCSTVDVIDLRTETILSKVCNIDVEVNNGFYSVCSKLELIQTTINNLTVNVDIGTINVSCDTSAIEALQFTLLSSIDNINVNIGTLNVTCDFSVIERQLETCCSVVDAIDIRTETILSKVCAIDVEINNGIFTLCSKIEHLTNSFCFEHILLQGAVVNINAPGSYQLCGDVGVVFINSSRVKLDLQQFSVQGNGLQGIVFAPGVNDVEIFNGVVENILVVQSGVGINAPLSNSNITIHDVIVRNWATGAQFNGVQRLVMENVITSSCSVDGIDLLSTVTPCQDVDLQNVNSYANANGLSVNGVSALRVEGSQFNNNSMHGVQITDILCGNFLNCTADRNGMDGYNFLIPALLNAEAILRDCTACGNGGNGYSQANVGITQFFNCIAQANTGNGFINQDALGSTFIQGCRSQGNGIVGFGDVSGADHHLYLANSACDNGVANYNLGNNLAVVKGPNNARGVQNVDCTITSTDEISQILSKVCLIEGDLKTCCSTIEALTATFPNSGQLNTCCSVIQQLITNLSTNVEIDFDFTNSLIHDSQFTLCSKIENLDVPDCCSVVDVIDHRTFTILSKVCAIEPTLQTCCSKIELDIHNAQFTLCSKIENLDIPDCCSVVDVIDHRTSTILSKVCLIEPALETCCSKIELDIHNAQFTLCSKIDHISTPTCFTVNLRDCCSQVDVIDHRTSTILSKVCLIEPALETCCSKIELDIHNAQFTLCSKIDQIVTPTCFTVNIPNCCSQVDVIDHTTFTILSKVCLIEPSLETCCSKIELDIHNAQFTLCSKIDHISTPTCFTVNVRDCCSQVDVIDHRTSTILSKVCLIEPALETCCSKIELDIHNAQFTLCSKIDHISTPTCINVNVRDCCSQVDVIDHTTFTILSKVCSIERDLKTCCSTIEALTVNFPNAGDLFTCCSKIELDIHNAQVTLCSKIDHISTPTCINVNVRDCCSQVDVIDHRTSTILSKVCLIEPSLQTCCSKIESDIHNAQVTLCSKIDNIQFNDCCSQIDALDKHLKTCCSVIESLIVTVSASICSNKVDIGFNQGGTITLSQPNTSYILCGNKFTGSPAIVITASNLRVDLNQFGVISTAGCNPGIVFGPGVQNVELFNGIIQSESGCDFGITATQGGNANIDLHDMIIRGWETAINFAGLDGQPLNRIILNNITISENTGDGVILSKCRDVDVTNCTFIRNQGNGCSIFDPNAINLEPDSRHFGFITCSFSGNIRAGLAIQDTEDVRCEECRFDGNAFGVQAIGLSCGNFIDCSASGNFDPFDGDGFRFVASELNETEVNMINCVACNNACNGFHEVTPILNPQFVTVHWSNCLATVNFCNGFYSESQLSQITVQGCSAYENGFGPVPGYGFADDGLALGSTTHLYLDNKACRNVAGNYDANIYALESAVIRGPNNARGVQNVDCLITTSDEIPEILSKVCLIESELEECCTEINSNIEVCCTELQNDVESCCGALQSDIESCCSQLNGNLQSCCGALQAQIQTCCDDIICKIDNHSVDEQILTKVCDIYDCVFDVDSCDKVVCLKDRVKSILKKVCTIESKIDAIDINCDNVTINVTCDIDQTILAKVCLLDIKADEIYKKIDTINNNDNPCKTKLIMSATTISTAGAYCLGASLINQDIKVDLGSAVSVVLDLNGYVVDDIKISSDKAGAIKNLVIKNGKAVSNITTDSKHGLNNASLQLENVSAQCVSLVKARGVTFRANGYIEALKVAGSEISADLEGSVVRNLNVGSNSKDVTVRNVRVVDYVTIHPESQFITLEQVDVGIDGNGELIVDNGVGVSLNKVTARAISFCNGCKNCLVRDSKCFVGGFKIFNGENVVCIDCESSGNASGAGFASSNSIATTFEHCNATENEEGFALATDQNSNIVRCTAKKNTKNGFKDRECMGCSVSECQANGNGLNGFNYLAATNKAQLNPTAYYLNFASSNSSANYSVLSTVSAPVKLLTDVRQYGDNLAATLP
jgi:hypothetical protein